MKKILFFINTLSGGGAEKVLVDLINMLDADKYELHLLTITGGVHEQKLSSNVHYRKILKSNNCISRFLKKVILKLPPAIFSLLFLKNKYDIEIAYLEGFPTKVIAAHRTNAKKITFLHCDVSVKPVLQHFYANKQKCLEEYKRFDSVVFVSNSVKDGFEKTFGVLDSSKVIHNVINTDEIVAKSNEEINFQFNTSGLKIISVGRLSSEKGFDRLIRIASEVEKKFDFEICILGDGPLKNDLEDLIKKLNVHSVRFLGFKENPYSYMKRADVYICSSLYEGYSTVVLEALHIGLPIITTRCAGMDEILHNGKLGTIVDNDEKSLKEALCNVLLHKNKLSEIPKIDFCSVDTALEDYNNLFIMD